VRALAVYANRETVLKPNAAYASRLVATEAVLPKYWTGPVVSDVVLGQTQ